MKGSDGGRPLRILMGVPDGSIRGGPSGHLPILVRELREQGMEVWEIPYGNTFQEIGPATRVVQLGRTAKRFRDAQRGRTFDIVQLNTSFDFKAVVRDLVVVLGLRRQGEKVVLKLHGSEAGFIGTKNHLLRRLSGMLIHRVDTAGVLSQEEKRNFVRAGYDEKKIRIVKNILDPSQYVKDAASLKEFGVPADVPMVLFAARFLPGKGVADVVRACGVLATRGVEFSLVCAGDGPEREEAEIAANKSCIAEKVRFPGFVPELRMKALYANATVLAFPTYYDEGFPMVIFQSVAAGLPVVTTQIRGAADYLREPDNCLWTEPRNPEMLADKLQIILGDGTLRRSMSNNNRILASSFVAGKVAGEFIALYRSLITPVPEKN